MPAIRTMPIKTQRISLSINQMINCFRKCEFFDGIKLVPKVAINNHEISYSFNGVSRDISSQRIVLIHGAGGQEIDWPMAWRNANDITRSMGLTPSNQGVSRLLMPD